MDLIARLMGHGRWFTVKFLEAALPLSDEQLDLSFDIGSGTYRKTAVEIVNVVAAETSRLNGAPTPEKVPETSSLPEILHAYQAAYDQFEFAAAAVIAGGEVRQDATYLDNYNIPQSYGGTLLFVLTQNVVAIADLRHFLQRLGVEVNFVGDVQEWEHFSGNIDRWGGQYPEGFVRPWER